jgi:hypothetical protein
MFTAAVPMNAFSYRIMLFKIKNCSKEKDWSKAPPHPPFGHLLLKEKENG